MNLPNAITLARICCVPLFLWIMASTRLAGVHGRRELLALAIFLLGSLTDGLDGFLARRTRQVTTLGTLLSPLADKLLLTAAYITLVQYSPELLSPWMVVLLIGREFLVTGLNAVAVQEGMTLRVVDIGKFKTLVQIVTVGAVLMAHAWPVWNVAGQLLPGSDIAKGAIWMMLTVSLLSASAYFRAFWAEAVMMAENRPKPRPFLVDRPGDQGVNAK